MATVWEVWSPTLTKISIISLNLPKNQDLPASNDKNINHLSKSAKESRSSNVELHLLLTTQSLLTESTIMVTLCVVILIFFFILVYVILLIHVFND
ncbi:hypothetical protein Hanom_Chr17g01590701 [Helianthus anomalus]